VPGAIVLPIGHTTREAQKRALAAYQRTVLPAAFVLVLALEAVLWLAWRSIPIGDGHLPLAFWIAFPLIAPVSFGIHALITLFVWRPKPIRIVVDSKTVVTETNGQRIERTWRWVRDARVAKGRMVVRFGEGLRTLIIAVPLDHPLCALLAAHGKVKRARTADPRSLF